MGTFVRRGPVLEHEHTIAPQSAPVPSSEAILAELDKILQNRIFQAATGQKNLLRYAVERTLQGCHDLKEYSVAIDVFGRGESFDPRRNSIVRTEARKLRASLARYYDSDGQGDPIRIEFPKGGYAPVFHNLGPQKPHAVPDQLKPASTAGPLPLAAFSLGRGWIAVAIVAIIALVVLIYFPNLGRRSEISRDEPSIAVLPFVNLSDNANDDFFSDGLTEDLIDSLVRVPGMHVVARTSVFQFKGKNGDVRKIGRDLNVKTVLTGSVRKFGDRLRITAQLSDTTNGYHLWAGSYDREAKDALMIQSEIAKAITQSLGTQLLRAKAYTEESAGRNPDAYEEYLKGRYFWNKNTPENIETAIEYFQNSIAKDPVYAPAYVGLAHSYAMLPVYGITPSQEAVPKIRAAASKALELDVTLGEAYVDLARAFGYEFDWSSAESEFKKGLELSPSDAVGHRWYGQFLLKMGRLDEALTEYTTALRLDPVSATATLSVGFPLFHMHRYDEALDQYRKALALEPNFAVTHGVMARALLAKGLYPQAISETESALKLMGNDPVTTGELGYAYALSGNKEAAQHILNRLLNPPEQAPKRALMIAHIYIGLGNKDNAFHWIQTAIDQRDLNLSLKADPIYDPLRSDPRFTTLLRQMKLI